MSASLSAAGATIAMCALPWLGGCAAATDGGEAPVEIRGAGALVAVFPVENLSGRAAPLREIRRLLGARLQGYGMRVVDEAVLERVFAKHRVRYTAGVEAGFAKALKEETGADGIVIASLEAFDAGSPPQVSLFARLVSTGEDPAVRWIDGIGAAGDDAPGVLGIGLIRDAEALLAKAVDALAGSLARGVSEAGGRGGRAGPPKFGPKIVYRSDALDTAQTYSVAVVPFFNRSARAFAGEIVALHMIRSLMSAPGLAVVEPGIVRQELLRFRIIMTDGISLPETETVLGAVNADLVLNGEVLEYQDRRSPEGVPAVDFGVLFIERRTRRVVYSSYSHNAGDDRVFFFDWGRVNTAHAMASRMGRAIAERMLPAPPAAGTRPRSIGQRNGRR